MAVSIVEAFDILDHRIASLSTEMVPIEESLGRTVASDYTASFNLPRFDNSAMDGYAVKCDNEGGCASSSTVIYAGDKSHYRLQKGEAIRIMTGAPVPEGCEAIVPIEEVQIDGAEITLPETVRPHAHIRYAGEDLKQGETYLRTGETITAYTLALLASQGITHIAVTRRVRVAVFGTGDELRPHYERIEAHQLYNSNAPMFLARAKELGCDVHYIGGSGDTIDSLKSCIREALDADLIITSGGVSVGDKDFTKEAFTELGMETFFSGIAIKPGKPTTIGSIGKTMIVNLPGNPLASMVNYELFVKFIIRKLSGSASPYHSFVETRIKESHTLRQGRYTTILGSYDGSGFLPLPQQSPGMVSPLPQADGLIITLPDVSSLEKGAIVKMLPIKWEISASERKDIFTASS